MTASISYNPVLQTNFTGTFQVQSDGYVQGLMQDDPVSRFALRSGVLSSSATIPMWGGFGIQEVLPGANAIDQIGSIVSAASTTVITGFSVFNQAAAMVQTPQSRVPLAGASMAVNFFRLGSGARIALPCSSATASALAGAAIGTALFWDTVAYQVTNSSNGNTVALPTATTKICHVDSAGRSKVVSYSSGTGFASWVDNGYCVVVEI